MTDSCLTDLDGHTGLGLLDVLRAAHAPHERMLVRERKARETEEAERQALLNDPEKMRDCLRNHKHRLASYLNTLNDPGTRAIELLLASSATPLPQESDVLRAIARDLADALPELLPPLDTPLGTAVIEKVALLVRDHTDIQAQQIRSLAAHHGEGPSLQRAWNQLSRDELLSPHDLDQLPQDAERDAAGQHDQHERQAVYLEWREQAARQLARKAGPLGRLTHRAEDFYPQLDHEHLKVCERCEETIYPAARENQHTRWEQRLSPCHYCGDGYQLRNYNTTASTESEAHQ